MSISRYLSIFADFLTSAGVLNPSGGGTGLTGTPSNGQIPIGNGTGYALSTLTQGSGVTITNGAGSITVSNNAAGTVTSVATGTGLTGGTITTSGTVSLVTTAGAVGTYAFLTNTPGGSTITFGGTQSGANLKPSGFQHQSNASYGFQNVIGYGLLLNSTQSGTWRCMGYAPYASTCSYTTFGTTVWIRIA